MTRHPEPIQDLAHLGGLELLTADAARSLWFLRELFGAYRAPRLFGSHEEDSS